eukprot:12311985-Alexandrium_andersonii.AAC.1
MRAAERRFALVLRGGAGSAFRRFQAAERASRPTVGQGCVGDNRTQWVRALSAVTCACLEGCHPRDPRRPPEGRCPTDPRNWRPPSALRRHESG